MTPTDAFPGWSTQVLVEIASRVTPRREQGRWITTVDNRWWRIQDGYAKAVDGTRGPDGAALIVAEWPEEDLREFVVEQLEHYGITLADVNYMKS